jgi:hypothetical protein
MDTIGLDLHKRESQLCVLADTGELTERRIATSRERFTDLYTVGDDRWGLYEAIAWEMYALARPGSNAPALGAPLPDSRTRPTCRILT